MALLDNPPPAPAPWHHDPHAPGSGWATQSGNYFEVYRSPVTTATLTLIDSWPQITQAEIDQWHADGEALWIAEVRDPATGRWYTVVEKRSFEDAEHFLDRASALARAQIIARDIADARVARWPVWDREDLSVYFQWFEAQVPNRVDYVRVLWANDPNGSYDGLLAEPVREAQAVFEEVFEPWLRSSASAS